MMPEGWKTYRLTDFVEINPKIGLKSGEKYQFVEMKDLNPSQKFTLPSTFKKLTGGTKFQNGDTLFARITPCLENGKICQVKGLGKKPGFGSTEFIVLRGKEKVSDNEFVYYLSRTDNLRSAAIQNMTGTSGRQRVEKAGFENIEITVPTNLAEQSRIASILSSLDDKIELNLQMNKTLEAIAQTIFKEWFVDFRFPGFDGVLVEGLPKGWRTGKVLDTCKVNANTLSSKDGLNQIQYIEISEVERGIIKNISIYNRGEEPSRAKRKLNHGDTVLSTVRPNRGSYFLAYHPANNLIASTGFAVFTATTVPYPFLYCFLTDDEQIDFYGKMADGAAYPAINPSIIMNMEIVLPSKEVLEQFNDTVVDMYSKIYENLNENNTLTQIRDTLLPKLMTGTIRVA